MENKKSRSLFVLKAKQTLFVKVKVFDVRETKWNFEVRLREHCSTKEISEVGDHFLLNPGHTKNWEILINAPKQVNKQKISEALYI